MPSDERRAAETSARNASKVHGLGASPGKAVGRALVLRDDTSPFPAPTPLNAHGQEDLIVVMLRPNLARLVEWIPYAAGFVFEAGGRLCHAALVCLELEKPCVVGAQGLTLRLSQSSRVRIDGDSGVVTILR